MTTPPTDTDADVDTNAEADFDTDDDFDAYLDLDLGMDMDLDADTEDEPRRWLLLMDPLWEASEDDESPPVESIAGVWPLDEEGDVGSFQPNPDYEPIDATLPCDPIDVVLRRLLVKEGEPEQVQLLLRNCLIDIAMNGDGRPLVMKAPDDVSCVVIATAEPHRKRIASPDWRRADLDELIELLPEGIDVLFNPGGPASVRMSGRFVRSALTLTDEEIAAIDDPMENREGLHLQIWDIADEDDDEYDEEDDDGEEGDGEGEDGDKPPFQDVSLDNVPFDDAEANEAKDSAQTE